MIFKTLMFFKGKGSIDCYWLLGHTQNYLSLIEIARKCSVANADLSNKKVVAHLVHGFHANADQVLTGKIVTDPVIL